MHSNLWAYNPDSNNWVQKTSCPGPARLNGTSFEVNGKIIIGGGHQLVTTNVLGDYYQYDPVLDIWDTLPLFSGQRRSSAADFTIGNVGYIAGGFDSIVSDINTFWSFKPLVTSISNKNQNNVSQWKVYPNPAKETLIINLNELIPGATFTVFSINGQEISNGNILESMISIDCKDFENGTYFVRLIAKNNTSVKKVIIVH